VSTDNGVSAIHDRAIRVNCELLTPHTRRIIAPALLLLLLLMLNTKIIS